LSPDISYAVRLGNGTLDRSTVVQDAGFDKYGMAFHLSGDEIDLSVILLELSAGEPACKIKLI
jgi:hypothetical protein